MLFTTFEVSGNKYKLRINTRSLIELEKALGMNPMYVFNNKENHNVPTVEQMANILYYSLNVYHSEMTLDDAYRLFDEWLDEGHIYNEFVRVITEIYIVSGIFKADNEKNV